MTMDSHAHPQNDRRLRIERMNADSRSCGEPCASPRNAQTA